MACGATSAPLISDPLKSFFWLGRRRPNRLVFQKKREPSRSIILEKQYHAQARPVKKLSILFSSA
jgi:hypothetical protein